MLRWRRSCRPCARRAISPNARRAPISPRRSASSTGQVSDSRPSKATNYLTRQRSDAHLGDARVSHERSGRVVGWVERSETHRIDPPGQDGKISAEFPAGRQLFLHGQSRRSPARAADRPRCLVAGRVSPGARTASLRDRSRRDPAGSPAHDLDPARTRARFRVAVAPDQERFFTRFTRR